MPRPTALLKSRRVTFALALIVLSALAGCGQKGGLTRPEDNAPAISQLN